MNCSERQDLLLLYAAGALDAGDAETRDLRGHLASGCPACAAALVEAEATVAHLPLALPLDSPRPELREQLLARVVALRQPGSAATSSPSRSRPSAPNWFAPAAAAAIAASLAAVATYGILSNSLRDTGRELAQLKSAVSSLEQNVADRDAQVRRLENNLGQSNALLAALQSRRLQIVSLDPQPPQQPDSAWGRVLWDHDQRRWHFHASGLKPAAEGKTYELWLVTADMRKLPAGTFDVDRQGNASLTVSLPPGEEAFALAAVTDEPAGGVPQPTGQFQLVGNIR